MLGRELEDKETQALHRLFLNLELIRCFCCEGHRKWEEEEVTWTSFHSTVGLSFPPITWGTEFQLYLIVP